MWSYREAQKRKRFGNIWQYFEQFSPYFLTMSLSGCGKTRPRPPGLRRMMEELVDTSSSAIIEGLQRAIVPNGTIPSQRLRWQKSLRQKSDGQFTISLSVQAATAGKIKSWTPYILPGWNTVTGHFNSQADTRVQFRVTRLFPGPNQH